MTSLLPDVALNERPLTLASIDWVGMQRIDVPITLDESGVFNLVHASADVHVDLPEPSIKGTTICPGCIGCSISSRSIVY